MAEAPAVRPGGGSFLTFRAGDDLYALPAERIVEVLPRPSAARVPHSPPGLLGLSNVRGSVVPLASLHGLLGGREPEAAPNPRAILLAGAAPIALAVDRVDGLVAVAADAFAIDEAGLTTRPGEKLCGAFRTDAGIAKVLDIDALLAGAFAPRPERVRAGGRGIDTALLGGAGAVEQVTLVLFEVGGQTFAIELDAVREIVTPPDRSVLVPGSDPIVLGLSSLRDQLLPLLSLRGLLGLPPRSTPDGRERVVIVSVRGFLVGLVADRVHALLSADATLIEPTPPVLAARIGGESRIEAIYRGEGDRLVSIIATSRLFGDDIMARLGSRTEDDRSAREQSAASNRMFVVFEVGTDEFALPIGNVDEVAPTPERITRVPKAPRFLEGVMNFRGAVVPVIDQRKRFGVEGRPFSLCRILVVRSGSHRAALIVDGVSGVLRTGDDNIGPAPDIAGEPDRLVDGVINLVESGRLILTLDPHELLTSAEKGLLDALSLGEGRTGS